MKKDMKTSALRNARDDGNATKELLIETAGKIIAQKGYEKTTSKEICERSQTNIAAVNYHFGSREQLYLAVLSKVNEQILSAEELKILQAADKSPQEKLELFLSILEEMVRQEDNWPIRVWIREITAPSALAGKMIREDTLPKLNLLLAILSDYTGLAPDSVELSGCMACLIAPFFWFLLIERSEIKELRQLVPIHFEDSNMVRPFRRFVLAGLQDFRPKQ